MKYCVKTQKLNLTSMAYIDDIIAEIEGGRA